MNGTYIDSDQYKWFISGEIIALEDATVQNKMATANKGASRKHVQTWNLSLITEFQPHKSPAGLGHDLFLLVQSILSYS